MTALNFNLQRFAYYGTSSGDYYSNSNSNTWIYGYGGNDTFYNYSSSVQMYGGDDNDSLVSFDDGSYVTLSGGYGNDTIYTWSNRTYIEGGDGSDYLYAGNYSGLYHYNSIYGGSGNDTIDNHSDYAFISGGEGNDVISLSSIADYTTLYFTYGDGSDIVYGYDSYDTVQIDSGYFYTTLTSGSDVLVSIYGSGTMTLKNAKGKTVNIKGGTYSGGSGSSGITTSNYDSNTVLSGTSYNDSIYNCAKYVTINTGEGNDTIYNYMSNVSINSGIGDDSIYAGYDTLTVDAGAGNDTIYLYSAWHSSINGGAGNDKFIDDGSQFSSKYTTIVGGLGNDTISLSGGYKTYKYSNGDGNDIIYNYSAVDTLNFGGASYSSAVSGSNVVFTIGSGAVTLVGASGKTLNIQNGYYSGGGGNSSGGSGSITNSTSSVTITSATSGKDTIKNTGSKVVAYGYGGNDSIYNSGYYSTLIGGDGDDTFYNYWADSVSVVGGSGSDSIYNTWGWDDTIDGGADNDTIIIYHGSNNSINGGAGNDIISVNSTYDNVTIKGGTGNDTIYSNGSDYYGVLYQYASGDGNDVIYNYKAADTVSIAGSTSYSRSTVGNDVLIEVANSGTITLKNAKGKIINVKGGTLNSSGSSNSSGKNIDNSAKKVKLTGTSYGDTIKNSYSNATNTGDSVTISAGAGNDYIYNDQSYYVTISGDDGADTIISYGGYTNSINGGKGNDKISVKSDMGSTTVTGGAGNDSIYGDSVNNYGLLYQYANGDGNDIIYGYKEKDSITITGGNSYSTQTSGNNVIVKVGSGSVTLVGAKGKTLNIYPQNTTTSTISSGGTNTNTTTTITSSTVTQKDVIQRFMKILDTDNSDGIARLNQAVNYASGGYFTNINAAFEQMVSDCKNSKSADEFLKNYCGIDLSNDDTGAITGKDAGGSTEKTDASIIPESGSLKNFTGNTFTTNGLTVTLQKSYSSLTNVQKYMWQALYTWWLPGAFDLISASYGKNFSFDSNSSATVKNMSVNFYSKNDGCLAYIQVYSVSGKADELSLNINMCYYNGIDTSDPNGSTSASGAGYLDRTLAHELTHAVMSANITYGGAYLSRVISEGMAELTHGIDDERKGDIQKLAGNYSLLQKSLRISTQYNESVSGVNAPDYAAGYMFLRYLAKQGSEHGNYSNDSLLKGSTSGKLATSKNLVTQRGITVKDKLLTADATFNEDMIDLSEYNSTVTKIDATKVKSGIMIVGNKSSDSIKAGVGKDTISGNLGNDTLYGGKGNDVIFGDAGNDIIYGEAGDDTLYGGAGKNTLTGGDGKDIFIYSGGEDFIADYTAGKDKVIFADSLIKSVSSSGSNIVFQTSDGKLTVKNGKGKKITVVDQDAKSTTQIYSPATGATLKGAVLTVDKNFATTSIKVADYYGASKIDASKATKALTLTGNGAANSLKGGSGNDTLSGGTGNDTLTGGKGKDVFIYSGGKDVITDYTAGQDKIKISSGKVTKKTYSGKDVILTIGTVGTLTVKNAKGSKISVTDSSNKTATYSKVAYSDTSALLDDNNFLSDENNLESITEKEFTVQNIETQNYNNLAQDYNKLITYTEDK